MEEHNDTFIKEQLVLKKDYFENILKLVDPNVMLNDEQWGTVIMDEDYISGLHGFQVESISLCRSIATLGQQLKQYPNSKDFLRESITS